MARDSEGRLHRKVAVITGAGSGIGRASAILFAQEGAKVAACDLSEAGLNQTIHAVKANGGEAFTVRLDVTSTAQVKSAMQACVDRYGTIDVLFNCAGIWLAGDVPTADISEDVWNSLISVHLTGQFLCCKHALSVMVRNRKGSIINISSISGLTSGDCHAYAAAKGGILSLTRSIAVSYAPYNIRANAICPGPVETPMMAASLADPARKERYFKAIPLGRFGQPEDIANYAVFLASDESSFVTGTTLPIDGGFTAR